MEFPFLYQHTVLSILLAKEEVLLTTIITEELPENYLISRGKRRKSSEEVKELCDFKERRITLPTCSS